MVFYMDSKGFQDHYLNNEEDQDILAAQYVLVSQRIMVHDTKRDNILVANSMFYPSSTAFSQYTGRDFRKEYYKQVSRNSVWVAMMLTAVLEKGYNVIFLCAKTERKLGYLEILAEYIYSEFDYPVYDYLAYMVGVEKLIKYDKDAVLKKCKKIHSNSVNTNINNILNTKIRNKRDEENVYANLLQQKKDVIVKIAKKMDIYEEGLSKKRLIKEIMLFL